jgi:Zn-dependent protease/CBS domain-containing protein
VGDSITLGRFFGIPIGINWSWLIVFGLITWTLADSVFPDQNPGLENGTYWAMAIVAAALFFASILLHELGHALQARRDRVEIVGITLWLFGGVARFAGRIPSAGAEFRITIAGPLVSLVLGGFFAGLAALADLPAAVDGVAAWLGYINLVLLVFNLLPAFPLDGGRVLRSALWARSGNLQRATEIAASVGRLIAFVLMGLAVLMLVLGNVVGGIWLGFIGWFLLQAAGAEAQQVTITERLGELTVRDLMTPAPVAVPADLPLGRFFDEVVWTARFTTYPVVENGHVVGLLPFRRVAQVPREEWERRTVESCMLPLDEVPQLTPGQLAADALPALAGGELGRALVLDQGRLVGLLSVSDLVRVLEIGGR